MAASNPDISDAFCPASGRSANEDLDDLLSYPRGIQAFLKALKKDHCQENLEFWLAVKGYRDLFNHEVGGHQDEAGLVAAEARNIYENYIGNNAVDQINISGEVRAAIREGVACPSRDLFDRAAQEVYRLLLHGDTFMEFKHSVCYVTMLEEEKQGGDKRKSHLDGKRHGQGGLRLPWAKVSAAFVPIHDRFLNWVHKREEPIKNEEPRAGRPRSISLDTANALHADTPPAAAPKNISTPALDKSIVEPLHVHFGPVLEMGEEYKMPRRPSVQSSLGLPPPVPRCMVHLPDGTDAHVPLISGHAIEDVVKMMLDRRPDMRNQPFQLFLGASEKPLDPTTPSFNFRHKKLRIVFPPWVDPRSSQSYHEALAESRESKLIVGAGITLAAAAVPEVADLKSKGHGGASKKKSKENPQAGQRRKSVGARAVSRISRLPFISCMMKKKNHSKKNPSSSDSLLMEETVKSADEIQAHSSRPSTSKARAD